MFSRLHGRAAPLLGAAVLSLCALGGVATAAQPTGNAPAATAAAVTHHRTINNGASGDGGAKGGATIYWRKARGAGYDSWISGSVTDTKADGRYAALEYRGVYFNSSIGWVSFGPTVLVSAAPRNVTNHGTSRVLHHVKGVQVRWCTRHAGRDIHCGNWR